MDLKKWSCIMSVIMVDFDFEKKWTRLGDSTEDWGIITRWELFHAAVYDAVSSKQINKQTPKIA